jgi:hypothetical protein
MSRRSAVCRHLGSRKNIAGMTGALVGLGLHLTGFVGGLWPVVVIGLYAVGALVAPPDPVDEPVDEPSPTDALRAEAEAQLTRVELGRDHLPVGAERAVRRIVRTVRLVLDRLDGDVDGLSAPERLADAAEIVRVELTASLDAFLLPAPTRSEAAARELRAQLEMIGLHADRLAEQVPGAHVRRAGDPIPDVGRLPPYRAAAVDARHDRDADGGHDDLHDEFDPVDTPGVGHAEEPGDPGADERGHDADQDGQPDRDVLLPGRHEAAEESDDGADDDRGDDSRDGHRSS